MRLSLAPSAPKARKRRKSDQPARSFLGGAHLTFVPEPPPLDVLETPLFLLKPPQIILPRTNWLTHRFECLNPWQAPEIRQKRRLHTMIAAVLAAVAPRTIWDMEKNGALFSPGRRTSDRNYFRITHPYQLLDVFYETISRHDNKMVEYQALELLLAMILREYIRLISLSRNQLFTFEQESRFHGHHAYKLEKQIKYVIDRDEHASVVKTIYERYFHMINYYCYSILSRESTTNNGTMFSLYCRATFFLARIGLNNTLLDQVDRQQLPKRKDVLFLVVRDQALRRRYNIDKDYATRLKDIVKFFPTD